MVLSVRCVHPGTAQDASRGLSGQNSFQNNSKVLFAYFPLTHKHPVEFSRDCVTCDAAIVAQTASKVCVCVCAQLSKLSQFSFLTWQILVDITHKIKALQSPQ